MKTARRFKALISSLLLVAAQVLAPSSPQAAQPLQIDKSPEAAPRGAVLIIHGLNTPIERFDEIVDVLSKSGFSTVRPLLSGHDDESFYDASLEKWDTEVLAAYKKAAELAGEGKLYCLGFSIGGALCTRLAHLHPELRLDGLILLAPALALKPYLWLGRLITPLEYLGVSLPGISPKQYKKLPSLSLYSYSALYALCESFIVEENYEALNSIKTIMLLRKEDELLSYASIGDWLRDNHLESWNVLTIPENPEPHAYQHLLIDKKTLGTEGWQIFLEALRLAISLPT